MAVLDRVGKMRKMKVHYSKKYPINYRSAGSVLLLTVMIMAVLTTVTLGSVAIRFDQLTSTDKVSNSSVAKLAADAGLAKLRSQLAAGTAPTDPRVLNLDVNKNTDDSIASGTTANFKPSPTGRYATYEPLKTNLPRCVAVGVISPWVNTGQYLFSSQTDLNSNNGSSPALIFHYANIVSDTALGTIANNQTDLASSTDKQKTISELTNLGHFYNPYSVSQDQSDPNYWLIKMGGPQDEFLTKQAADGTSSYYKNLDFVYIPYLPRFSDSGLFDAATSGTQVDRITGDALRTKFETIIKTNNFKVWLDAAMSDQTLFDYGLGDLFVSGPDSAQYRVQWLQPTLWNDSPESDLMGPYKSADLDAAKVDWSKQGLPSFAPVNNSSWSASIIKGSKSFSFFKLNPTSSNTTFSPNATIDGFLFGSLEGLRLNRPLTIQLYDKNSRQSPLALDPNLRSYDQGKLYNVVITRLGAPTSANGIESYPISFRLSSSDYDTPRLSVQVPGIYPTISNVNIGGILLSPQFTTQGSVTGLTLNDPAGADGLDVDVTVPASPNCTSINIVACPAVGDLVNLTKSGVAPTWGKVKTVTFNSAGTVMTKFSVDQLRLSPKPVRDQSSTAFTDPADGKTKIAYYGGAIDMNSYDGGNYSEMDELWVYDPEQSNQSLAWTYKTAINTPANNFPLKRAGAVMTFDSLNNRLLMFGGYYHETTLAANCPESSQLNCLYTNRVGARVARRITNDVYAYSLSGNSWEKIAYSFDATKKVQPATTYQLKVASTLADRSGLEDWLWNPVSNSSSTSTMTLNVDGTPTDVQIYNGSAGLAKGDEVFLNGTIHNGGSFTGWGKITDTNFVSKKVTLVVRGYQSTSTQLSLDSLSIMEISRSPAANTCGGGTEIVLGQTYYYCTLANGGDTTGYSIGDEVVLEQYDTSGTPKIINNLTGYISYIDTGKVYFISDEKNATIADFSADSPAGKIANESAVSFPSPRYGGAMLTRANNNSISDLYQGSQKNKNVLSRMADIWQVSFTAGQTTGATSAVWSMKTLQSPAPSALTTYVLMAQKTPWQQTVFTSTGSPQMSRDKCPDNLPGCTDPAVKVWNDSTTWTLPLQLAGVESNSFGKLVNGGSVVIERVSVTAGGTAREDFHGIINSATFTNPTNNGSKVVVQHNPAYPGDPGLDGANHNSDNAKITLSYSIRSDFGTGTGNWNVAGGYYNMSNITNATNIPPVGATILIYDSNVTGNSYDVRLLTIKKRTYDSAQNSYQFYPTEQAANAYLWALNSPLALYSGSNQAALDGANARILTISDEMMPFDGQGGLEWYATPSDAETRWQGRYSAKDATYNDRPTSRQGGAITTPYGSSKTSVYLVGGTTVGRYATLWRESNAAKADSANRATWGMAKSSAQSASDIPNLFGGSLISYRDTVANVNKAVYFGGKQKYDGTGGDYGRWQGPRIYGRPDLNQSLYTINDNSYSLAGQTSSTVAAAGFANTLQKNFTGPNSVSKTFQLSGSGLSPVGASWDYAQNSCAYIGQASGCTSAMQIRNLGRLGRISGDAASSSSYGGYSWGDSYAVINPGSAFLSESSSPSLILSGPTRSLYSTNGRWDSDGYYPYLADNGNPIYGTNTTNFASDKTLMFAGFAKISGGGSLLVTPVGVALGLTRGSNSRWYSYCAKSDVNNLAGGDYTCKSTSRKALTFLPDPEDLVFMYNAALNLSSTDSYKVVGYYGGVRRGYLVVSRTGTDLNVQEIVP